METTSRKYYEDKLREFNQYRRGRSLQQFCKDEGIDYKWMLRAKKEYASKSDEPSESTNDGCPSLIQLHYDDEGASAVAESKAQDAGNKRPGWTVGSFMLTDPDGNEITISSGSAAALGSLLTKLAACHD